MVFCLFSYTCYYKINMSPDVPGADIPTEEGEHQSLWMGLFSDVL